LQSSFNWIRRTSPLSGHHYVAVSEATGLVKIGDVVGSAEGRAETLNRQSYGALNDWRIVYTQPGEGVGNIEALARARIKDFRVSGQTYRGDRRRAREIFNCSIATAVEAVKRAAGKAMLNWSHGSERRPTQTGR
jgi:hypothetical protein